jgi:HD superfamily phosphohydrolase
MEFKGRESVVIEILRTPELQRLRRIRQLGLAHLVFPGAEHSRLVHSLGAAQLAIRFGRQLAEVSREILVEELRPGDDSIRDLAVAALCHDLGHGPLSHAWEREVVGRNFNREEWVRKLGLEGEDSSLENLGWHELVGHALLMWKDGHLHQLLERDESGFSERVSYLLRGQYFLNYLPRLLSSDVDVDRADFLMRDAYQCGVAYGRYDLDRLVSTCTLGHTEANRLVMGFQERKAVRVVEQFLIARHALYETVYYHKTVHSAEGMVGLFLKRLKEILGEENRPRVSEFVKPMVRIIAGEALEPHELLSLDDFSLWVLLDNISSLSDIDPTVRDLARRIISRDLFKMVPCSPQRLSEFLREEMNYAKLYDVIQPYCTGKAEFYVVVDTTRFSMFSDDEEHMVYFINEDQLATPALAHESIRHHWQRTEDEVRLFTVLEAVEAVKSLIG